MRPWTNKPLIFGIIGLVLIVVGVTLCCFWPMLFQHILQTELPLSPNGRSFEMWSDSKDFPMNIDFYFFNWTNPEEFLIPGKKPQYVELGPYSFRERRQKEGIVFHPENFTVSYLQRRFWTFDPERSTGTLQDNITQINVVAVSAVHKVRFWSSFFQSSLSYILNSQSTQLYVTRTVDQLLFTGYSDPLIDMGQLAPIDDGYMPPFDRFGWFYERNGSTNFEGHFNIGTGADDIQNLGVIKSWNMRDSMQHYNSPCNVIEGSAGEFWPPGRTTTEDIMLFSTDMCRPLTFEYTRTISRHGIEGYQYAIDKKTLSNDTKRRYPHENAKYFQSTTTTEDFFEADHSAEMTSDVDPDTVNLGHCYCNGECAPSGLLNITACRYGAPGFVSLPHFYKADPVLRDQVVGMNPQDEKHNFYITLEPTTGIPLEVGARLQINILVQPSPGIPSFRNVPKLFLPVFWFSMKVGISKELSDDLKQLLLLPSIGLYMGIVLMTAGSVILFAVAVFCYIAQKRAGKPMELKSRSITDPNVKKTELVYTDSQNANDDPNIRQDRCLYPK